MTSSWAQRYNGPTILSTLDPETEPQSLLRQVLTKENRCWSNNGHLTAVGVIIGKVVEMSSGIFLEGQDELAFQTIRDFHNGNPQFSTDGIMSLWEHRIRMKGYGPNTPAELFSASRPLSRDPNPPRDSIEYHLLSHARQTTVWKGIPARSVIRDKNSIVDTKQLATYQRFNEKKELLATGLALLPSDAGVLSQRPKELIVYLRGARVPFIVRSYSPDRLDSELLGGKQNIRQKLKCDFEFYDCVLVGECFINGFEDIVKEFEAALERLEAAKRFSTESSWASTPFVDGRIFVMY